MTGYEWLGAALMYLLALWVVLSGLDDVFVQAVAFWLRLRGGSGIRTPSESDLRKARLKRIAVFVPLWREHHVIRRMLEHNLAAVRYPAWDVFVGVYPNDPETGAAVAEAAALFPNVHLAMCPHPGPTSKADCLNWVYQRMLLLEEERRVRFEAVVIHDAEDLIHPESLRLIAYWLEKYDMVQIPVLPLPTPPREWTHGLYCDEFAQYQSTDIPVRQFLGGFIASNGVGTGFSRAVLEALAGRDGNRIFEPSCLTEDYDAGFRVHALGRPQLFVPIHYAAGGPVATREYFPRSFRAAIRQRTRWVMGIALQGWERHGWRVPRNQLYWLWRDRKGVVNNILSPVGNLLLLWGIAEWMWGFSGGRFSPMWIWDLPGMPALCACTLAISAQHLAVRAGCSWRVYGPAFAAAAPLRAIFGNALNCIATVVALWRYFGAKLRGEPLVWLKTDHTYPSRSLLMPHKRRLGEILVTTRRLRAGEIERALATRLPGERIGECLVRTGRLTERQLYQALSAQHSLPFGRPSGVSGRAAALVPPRVARRWRVAPFEAHGGKLFVAGPELPCDEMTEELQRWSRHELRFQLVTPGDYRELAEEHRRVTGPRASTDRPPGASLQQASGSLPARGA
jgi:bacteriophage N4 adsorption protein B